MPTIQSTYLVLSSTTTATYETIRDRIYTANASKVSYTITDTELQLNATDTDVNELFLVDCLIPNDERTATNAAGDLSSIARSNIDTAFFRMEMATDAEIPLMAPDMLGRTSRSAVFVRPEKGSAYGGAHGKTWRDARDGFEDASLPAAWATNTTHWMCGSLVGTWRTGAGPKDRDPDFQDADGAVTRWRMDYSHDPGMLHIGYILVGASTSNQFTQPDASGFPRVWKAPNTSGGRWLTPVDPTLSTTDIYTNHLFKTVSSQAEIQREEMTRWYDGTDLWIHMPDDTDPTERIADSTDQGWNPSHGYMNTAAPLSGYRGIEFINCQFVGGPVSSGAALSKDPDGLLADGFPQAKFLGGRALVGCSFKPKDKCIAGTEWGRSADGSILWDTSDRPDPATDIYIAKAVAKGSDQKIWNQTSHFFEIDSSNEGVYWFHGGTTNNPDDGAISGLLARHIGTRHPVLQTKLGSDGYDDADSHALGNQGSSNWDIGFIYVEKAGSAFNWYSVTDGTNAQNIQNNIVHDFVIRDNHNKYSTQTAGMNAINFNGDGGTYLRANGTGLYAGNQILRGCIANIIGDPDDTAFGSPAIIADGGAIIMRYPTELYVDSVHFVNCTHAFEGQLNNDMALGDGGVTNPERGGFVDQQLRAHNCTYEEIVERIVYQRATKWNNAYKTVVSITKADPCVVEITGHGFPDILDAGTFVEPEVYFDNMVGMTELHGNEYKAVWIDANTFSLQTIAGVDVDSTGFGTFTSGDCNRSNAGYLDLQDNTIILKSGQTSADDIYRYSNNDQTLAELQALTRRTLPGAASNVLEAGTVIE